MGFPWFLDVFHIGIASVLPSGKLTVLMGLLMGLLTMGY